MATCWLRFYKTDIGWKWDDETTQHRLEGLLRSIFWRIFNLTSGFQRQNTGRIVKSVKIIVRTGNRRG
jgi:hypothetical protein